MVETNTGFRPEETETRTREYLSSPLFLRFAEGWILYQKMYQEAESEEEKVRLKKLMRDIYPNQRLLFKKEEVKKSRQEQNLIQDCMFRAAENPLPLTTLEIAHLLIASFPKDNLFGPRSQLLEEGTPETGKVNEFVSYTFGDEYTIFIHLAVMPPEGTRVLLEKLIDGFKEIARRLKTGEEGLEKVEDIMITSWLLGSSFQEKLDSFFGTKGVHYKEVDGSIKGIGGNEIALRLNKRALENYLKTGYKPEVRQLTLSKEVFLEKFGR